MIYQISSGQGPAECELGVAKLLDFIMANYDVTVLDASAGYNEGTYRSVRIFTEDDLSEFLGSVQWVCRSPYRPNHKRKNWFIDFSECRIARTKKFDPERVTFETFRSGGKGGQNVNKVESGERAIYEPTGLSVVCTEERSQYANKQKAVAKLLRITKTENQAREAAEKRKAWQKHTAILRGNASVNCGEMLL